MGQEVGCDRPINMSHGICPGPERDWQTYASLLIEMQGMKDLMHWIQQADAYPVGCPFSCLLNRYEACEKDMIFELMQLFCMLSWFEQPCERYVRCLHGTYCIPLTWHVKRALALQSTLHKHHGLTPACRSGATIVNMISLRSAAGMGSTSMWCNAGS